MDEMGLGKTSTSVAAAMICKLLTEKVIMGLQLSIVGGKYREVWVNIAQTDFRGIIGEELELDLLQRLDSVPRRLSEIQVTLPLGHLVLTSALEPILVVTMHRVAETFKSVINEMIYETDLKLVNLLHVENATLTHDDMNTSIDEPENRWNIHHVPYNTLTSRVNPSINGQFSYCSCRYRIFDESHRYRTTSGVGWDIGMNVTIGFKH